MPSGPSCRPDSPLLEFLLGEAVHLLGARNARLLLSDTTAGFTVGATWGLPVGSAESAIAAALASADCGARVQATPTGVVVLLPGAEGALVGAVVSDLPQGSVPADRDAARAFSTLAGIAIEQARAREATAREAEKIVGTCRGLEATGSVERQLGLLVGTGAGSAGMVAEAARLAGKVVSYYDVSEAMGAGVSPGGQPQPVPPLRMLLAAAGVGAQARPGPIAVEPHPSLGLDCRALLVRVETRTERFGWLAVFERPSSLTPLDRLIARRAARFLAREMTVQRRIDNVSWSAQSSLARQLIRGTRDIEDLRESARHLGIDHESRRVLVHLVWPQTQRPSYSAIAVICSTLGVRLGVEVIGTRAEGVMILLIAAPPGRTPVDFVGAVKAALRAVRVPGTDGPTAGVSSVSEAALLHRALREAREVVRCIDRFPVDGAVRVLAADDLGPARLFVANTEANALHDYVEDTLGPLLSGAPGSTDLIRTLSSFVDSGRSVRGGAVQLGVHENTIRLRLARIHAMTGIDVAADANDLVSAQTALLIMRLQGHPALRSFDDGPALPWSKPA